MEEPKPKTQIPLVAIVAVVVGVGAGGFLCFAKADKTSPVAAPASSSATTEATAPSSNVKIEEYMQTIEISAKGGYEPTLSVAKANLPIVLNINTNSTYDCSAALVIPSINYRTRLPLTGTTTVQLAPQPPGTELTGVCSMGMYSFKIKFEG
jgi:hypothetical protein